MSRHKAPLPLDLEGYSPLPLPLHLCMWLLCRSVILLVMALASRAQSADLLALFYPDPDQLYEALLLALPALLCTLAAPYRHRAGHRLYHALWRAGYWLLLISALGQLGWLTYQWWGETDALTLPRVGNLLIALWCPTYLLLTRKVRTRFQVVHP